MKLQFIVTTGARVTELPIPFLTFSLFIFNKITILFYIFFLSLTCPCPFHTLLCKQQLTRVEYDPYISGILLCG
jgi:hypothetical protein